MPTSGELRQGDVAGLPVFPYWDLKKVGITSYADGSVALVAKDWDRAVTESGQRLVVVCSHDCDLENPRSRTGILVAPVLKIPATSTSQRYSDILASAKLVAGEYSYINLYPFLMDETWVCADFSAITFIATASAAVAKLGETRVFSMSDEQRGAMRGKLAFFVGRP